jgi:CBS domain containing-hemolysin-like protein
VHQNPGNNAGAPRKVLVGDWIVWVGILSTLGLLLSSTLNVALRSPSRSRIADQLDRLGGPDALKAFITRRHDYAMTMAVWRSAAVIALFVTVLGLAESGSAERRFAHTLAACVVAWAILLVFGVAIPYAWAKYAGESLIVRLRRLLAACRFISLPLIAPLGLFDPLVRRLAGVPVQDARSYADKLEEEILSAVTEGELHGAVDSEEKQMIESVIELGEQRVDAIMTPRTEIIAVPVEAGLDTVLTAVREHGHSRIPVYESTIDTILGVLYAKDLLRHRDEEPFDLRRIMRKALFIPESKPVRELLREFQKQKLHIAVVLDEYGGTAGLVTIEDILEEVVGDIADEYEQPEPEPIKRIDDFTYEVDARVRIDDLNERLRIEVPEHPDYETVGGYVFSTLGKIPKVGERCERDNFALQVIGAEPRRVTRVLLTITPHQEDRPIES